VSGILTSVMRRLPEGTVTFLFTDVERSTELLQQLGAEQYAAALAEHRRLLREAFAAYGGVEIDTQGDAFFVAFASAPAALAAATEAQSDLERGPLSVRMGIHTGTPLVTPDGYVGTDVHRAARIAAAGRGGQMLVSAATAALVERSRFRDLGEHRLKDLTAPERIYQVGDARFPPLKSLYRTNLPVPVTSFLGREADIDAVQMLLAREEVRLVTLTGPGGSGKTRLALQAAAAGADRYRDGVFWVALAALRDPKLVLPTVAAALETAEDVAAEIRSKRMLLVLDNFEQVGEAAEDVAQLVVACPHLDLIITSREPLHLTGEWVVAVPPLDDGDAVSLFLERARAARSDFSAGDEVGAICRRLDNLPLAIELAAARVRALSAAALLERLDAGLPVLTHGPRDAPERQQTLRATIAWSYELLTQRERAVFARLAIFLGGWTAEAAERVCGTDLDVLASLVEKNLVRYRDDRYAMLETIREFADEELTRIGEREATTAAHADYFLELAERAESHYRTRDQAKWIAALAPDYDNLRAALRHLDRSPLQIRLASALAMFWYRRGHHSEGREWLTTALSRRDDASPADVARALLGSAVLARRQLDFAEAERLAADGLAAAQQAADRRLVLRALGGLANLALARRDYERASELYTEVEALCRELDDQRALAITLTNRAHLATSVGDYELAIDLASEARDAGRALADPAVTATACLNLSDAARLAGKGQVASDAAVEAITLARELEPPMIAEAILTAAVLIAPRDANTAAALLATAERAASELMVELSVDWRESAAEVAAQVREALGSGTTLTPPAGDLAAVLDAAATRALDSLAYPTPRPP
jgi:predicted ATPase/class 3 adenylate cyclase